MAEDQEQTRLLQQMLEALNRAKGDTNAKEVQAAKKALTNYNLAVNRSTRAEQDRVDAVGSAVDMTKKATVGTTKFIAATAAAASAIRENREDFNSLNPAINLVGDGLQMVGKVTGAVVDSLGDALKGLPVVGGFIGGAVSGFGKLTAALGEAAGEIVKTIGPMLTAELQRASTAFRNAGSVAALGEQGLTGLANQAIDASLSFTTFSNVLKNNSEAMIFATRNSAESAQMLANTSKAMQPFQRGLLALGISVEQQTELTANYIGLQQRLNRNQAGDARALAAGSKNYIQQLTELSKLTGKSVAEQQKELEAQTRHVRMSAAMREVERKLGAEAGKKAVANIQGVAAVLDKAAPTLAAGFKDATGGNFKSEAAKNFFRATGQAGIDIMNQLKAGTLSRERALAGIQTAAAKRYQSMGGDKFAMAAGNTGTALEAILVDLQSLTFGAKFGDQIGKIETATKKNMDTTDKTTNAMLDAQKSLIESAKALDALALQKSLPLAATAISKFTKLTADASKSMLAYADAFNKGGVQAIGDKLAEQTGAKKVMDKAEETSSGKILAGGAAGAATGALIGSFMGPLGIAIGGALGAAVGAGTAFFAGPSDKDKEANANRRQRRQELRQRQRKLAGPSTKMEKANISQAVNESVKPAAGNEALAGNASSNQYNAVPNNDNVIASELQTTNKLLKGIYQQARN